MTVTLFYHPGSAPCRVVWTFLIENKIDFNLEFVNISKNEQICPEFLELNPAHTVPTLVDDSGEVIFESATIIRYLTMKFDTNNNWFPFQDIIKKSKVNQYLSWSALNIRATIQDYLQQTIWYKLDDSTKLSVDEQKRITKQLSNNLKVLNRLLIGNGFLIGDEPSIADLVIYEELLFLSVDNYSFQDLKHIGSWQENMQNYLSESYEEVHHFLLEEMIPTIKKSLMLF
eukprot:TRINITY_DN208_c4_g1_i1.p1 TRINITY_DN208_c4_g1~~TRINITY_DN208_c4_g1_i1.p1  ORF type:complete len:229 (+),score=53.00 TRINITY_DN208_c4_g1_i1:55-741(+)